MKESHDIGVYLEDILESVGLIEEYARDAGKERFDASLQVQDAIIRRLEIIGEAVRKIPAEYKDAHDDIVWKQIAGMRNVLIHEYSTVNMERVWETIEKDFPEFKKRIAELLEDLPKP